MEDPLIETWNIHNRVNLYLLDAVPAEALGLSLAPKFRTAYQLFAHVHNVRLMWLKSAAPDLLAGLEKLEGTDGDKAVLRAALEASAEATEELLRRAVASGGKVKGFKPHVTAFLGYLIAHESHHRGQVGWTLKGTGHPLDKKTAFGLWEWGVR
ncbi:MAG TPA: DinB family protein [Gemmataceae bacterium]|nr:DinB family protein [Gemmataceae bacterium]